MDIEVNFDCLREGVLDPDPFGDAGCEPEPVEDFRTMLSLSEYKRSATIVSTLSSE